MRRVEQTWRGDVDQQQAACDQQHQVWRYTKDESEGAKRRCASGAHQRAVSCHLTCLD
jgi:hypothetical protein